MRYFKIAQPKPLAAYIIEGALSLGEIFKYQDPATQEYTRVGVLINKITNSEPITLVNGTDVIFPPEANAEVLKVLSTQDKDAITSYLKGDGARMSPVFVDNTGKRFKLNDLLKSADFGGAKGGGAKKGAKQTEEQEVGQAIVCGAYAINPSITVEDLMNPDVLMQGAKRTIPPQDAVQQIPNIQALIKTDPAWADTFIKTAQVLDKHIGLRGKVFHRGGPLVAKINGAFQTVNTNTKPKMFTNINKWNPSDIWISSPEFNEEPPVDDFNMLNRWIMTQYKKGALVGVSLKKASKNPSVSVVNENPGAQRLRVILDKLIVSKTASGLEQIMKSGDSYMTFKKESRDVVPLSWYFMIVEAGKNEMQYRSFNKGSAIQGELGGEEARHGKIGFGNIDAVLSQLTGHHLTTMGECKRMSRDELLDGIVDMAAETMGLQPSPAIRQAIDKNSRGKDMATLWAKYQAVELVWRVWQFRQKNPKEADMFIERLLQYAQSSTPLSSVFIKVS